MALRPRITEILLGLKFWNKTSFLISTKQKGRGSFCTQITLSVLMMCLSTWSLLSATNGARAYPTSWSMKAASEMIDKEEQRAKEHTEFRTKQKSLPVSVTLTRICMYVAGRAGRGRKQHGMWMGKGDLKWSSRLCVIRNKNQWVTYTDFGDLYKNLNKRD